MSRASDSSRSHVRTKVTATEEEEVAEGRP